MAQQIITQVDWNRITLFINNKILIQNINVLKDNGYLNSNKIIGKTVNKHIKQLNQKLTQKQLDEIQEKVNLAARINSCLVTAKLAENEFLKTWDAEQREKLERLADNINMINNQFIQLELKDREELTLIIDSFYMNKMKEYEI